MELTQARVRELFDYRDDGQLIWKIRSGRAATGHVAGTMDVHGYKTVRFSGKTYKVHRLVFLWHHGFLPEEVDHVNMNRSDNRVENLRSASTSQNQANRRARSVNASGLKGVTWKPRHQKWEARIGVNGRLIYIGLFDSPEKAHAAYVEAARRHHGEFARAS